MHIPPPDRSVSVVLMLWLSSINTSRNNLWINSSIFILINEPQSVNQHRTVIHLQNPTINSYECDGEQVMWSRPLQGWDQSEANDHSFITSNLTNQSGRILQAQTLSSDSWYRRCVKALAKTWGLYYRKVSWNVFWMSSSVKASTDCRSHCMIKEKKKPCYFPNSKWQVNWICEQ